MFRLMNVEQSTLMKTNNKNGAIEFTLPKSSPLPVDADLSQLQLSESGSQSKGHENAAAVVEGTGSQSHANYMLEITSPYSHRVLFSASTRDREFMRVYLGDVSGFNINIIPHPTTADLWVLVAQGEQQFTPMDLEQRFALMEQGLNPPAEWPKPSEQIVCTAGIQNDFVICAEPATTVPFAGPQLEGVCLDELSWLYLVFGQRDARVFMGPDIPYMMYGAKAKSICFGQWLQDARSVLFQFKSHRRITKDKSSFHSPLEVTRASGARGVEKNYFLFWDGANVAYVHYTLWPKRAFSRLQDDGAGSSDLAKLSEYHDQICMAKFMPPVKKEPQDSEDIHQATNSLAITMCKRSDQFCRPDDSNTFIMHLFHHKTYLQGHAMYEPYVVLFQRYAPFAIHAIGQRPYWIHGRGNFTETTESLLFKDPDRVRPVGHTEMFYITSMNWKSHLQKYHGYIDDVLFISFGIEDVKSGIIDVVAGDLFDDLAYC